MNIEFKWPWIAVDEFASNLEAELKREVTNVHPLWGKEVQAIAQRVDSDDVCFSFVEADGTPRFAAVHLTWKGAAELGQFPYTEVFDSLEKWVHERMMPDHFEVMGE